MIKSLAPEEYNSYYGTYIAKVTSPNIVSGLQESRQEFLKFVEDIPEDKLPYAYAEGKWTVAEVIQHLLDTERIFNYRALCFARNDKSPLPGFEQDDYVPFSGANSLTKEQLVNDYKAVRDNSIALFSNFSPEMLERIGTGSGSPMSCRAAGYIMIGHQYHHLEVLKERYL